MAAQAFLKLSQALQRVMGWLLPVTRHIAVRIVVNLLVLGFGIGYLVRYSQSIIGEIKMVQVNGVWLILACLLTWTIVWSGAVAWWYLLLSFKQPVSWLGSWRSHLRSSITKYIPGYAWQYLSKAYLTNQMGVSPKVVGILLVWEFVQLLWSGIAIGLLLIPVTILAEWGFPAWSRPVPVILGIAMLLIALGIPVFAPRLSAFAPLTGLAIQKKYLYLSIAVMAANWLLLGLTLWLTAAAFGILRADTYLFFVFAITFSMAAGILALPVPNGLGVREGIMAYLLSHFMPMPIALLVAGVSRIEIVTGELICVLIIELLQRVTAQKGPENLSKQQYS